jgi:hypothetical protein
MIIKKGCMHKVILFIEYRAVSGVFRTIDPQPPLHPASMSSPRTKGGGYSLAGRKTPDIGLASIIPLRMHGSVIGHIALRLIPEIIAHIDM